VKILIAYAGKSGTSQKAAELLASEVKRHDCEVADLTKTTPVLGDFDYIVLGGSIRFGKAHRALRAFLTANEKALCEMPHTLFLCCGIPEQFENYLIRTYSKDLLDSAEEALYFGGELNVANQKGFDKLVARMIRNSIEENEDDEAGLPGFLPEHVRLLADRLRVK
jgi:menaquinone-dependent protoporphyrinogen oxidase